MITRRMLFVLGGAACVYLCLMPLPARADTPDRIPVPTTQAAQEAEKLVKDVYKDEYAKRGPEERKALAARLLEDGRNNKADPASQYVLLREARDAAAQVGDVEVALDAITEMGKVFVIDVPEAKLATLNTIRGSARGEAQAAAAEATLALLDEASAADNFDVAAKAADLSLGFATAAKDMSLVTEIQARKLDIKAQITAYMAMKIGADKLKKDPKDPQANADVGSYLAFYKGDWDKGLPLLANGNDPMVVAAAKADLAAPVDDLGMSKVGDLWFDLASARPLMRNRIMVRAEFWYNLVAPTAEGLLQTKVQKRLDQIAALKSTTTGNLSEATRKALPTPAEIKQLKELYAEHNPGSQQLYRLKETLLRRLQPNGVFGSDADFFARCKADMQLRKIFLQNGDNAYVFQPLIQSFDSFAQTSKTKEEYASRLVAFDRFNQTEKAVDQMTFDNIVYASVRNFVIRNVGLFPTQAARLQFCAMLKAKGVKSPGLERYKTYLERSRTYP